MDSFTASFAGECWNCGGDIAPGDEIERVPGLERTYQHRDCPEGLDDAADVLALASPRCPACGLNHPGEC